MTATPGRPFASPPPHPCLLASGLLLGGCYSYQSVSGKIYDSRTGGAEAALVESGSMLIRGGRYTNDECRRRDPVCELILVSKVRLD